MTRVMGRYPQARRSVWCAPGVARVAAVVLCGWIGASAASASDASEETDRNADPSTVEGSARERGFLSAPPFPELAITEAFRVELGTFGAPDASIGSGQVSVVRNALSARATWLANERMSSRIALQVAETRYGFRGDVWGVRLHPLTAQALDYDHLIGDLDLHAARVAIDGAYLVTDRTDWFADGERWAVLGSVYGGSRWEDGDFDSGLGVGGALGVGYEVAKELRVALGVSLGSPIDDPDLDINPLFSLRWRPNDVVTLRSRELGLQVELALTPVFSVFLTGFRSSDGYRLRDRPPLGDLSFRERNVRIGAGFEWTLANWLHLEFEAGALADRSLRVHEEHLGTLVSSRSGGSPYLELRLELRL
jgi:hypothetical protein